ncbi:uncharacterized protein LOC111697066 isoform X1 [Eurytemora carolleeae]|uniref:uncharacterized protein LOC111697066 isoform X1 n=1 Tax=Eurytemora carolleeae TaxID=1294199 RepID=UPI000C77B53B|nr:uncharacterized protein LOC111697066 isoform X1 [Eurytemora carolleeae]XP_023322709.1 uncharacterized protein LOC111697066 isoform X2 [Eurytemora carolleeae]XP_023322711.1 uncharacterized protein LOC111697066 isoform X1 [Eurytemora carolleeae]|eukprot:XP_023322708.1 uncharacterized protein LOC111697066 isoform X1 [Eurytemora affinis]
MSGTSSWFFLWVPAREFEKEKNSKERVGEVDPETIGSVVSRPGASRAWSFSTLRSRDGSICQGKPASDQTQDTRKPYTDPAQDTRKPYTDPAQETRKPGGEEPNTLSNRSSEEKPGINCLPAIQEDVNSQKSDSAGSTSHLIKEEKKRKKYDSSHVQDVEKLENPGKSFKIRYVPEEELNQTEETPSSSSITTTSTVTTSAGSLSAVLSANPQTSISMSNFDESIHFDLSASKSSPTNPTAEPYFVSPSFSSRASPFSFTPTPSKSKAGSILSVRDSSSSDVSSASSSIPTISSVFTSAFSNNKVAPATETISFKAMGSAQVTFSSPSSADTESTLVEDSFLKYEDSDEESLDGHTTIKTKDDRGSLFEKSTMSFLELEPMQDVCENILKKLEITPVTVQPSIDNKQVLFTFVVPYDLVEAVLLEFQNQGIGSTGESTISVVPSGIHFSTQENYDIDSKEEEDDDFEKFYTSVKSRLLVAEVIARIQAGAEFSFDFLLLLLLAGAISFMGLVENSSVVLVASMLVSPLMGPILAGIFGCVIHDTALIRKGIRHEVLALLICILLGLVLGLIISPLSQIYGCPQYPTPEMLSRGELRSLLVGVLIATPSGAGVALSVLGGNAGSLVGVAISASLLPPAINCGMFWSLSIVILIAGQVGHGNRPLFHGFGTAVDPVSNLTVSLYEFRYSENQALEAFLLGLTSLALTLTNILFIIVTGVFILHVKEVTPEKIPQKFSDFWRKDVKAHRNYYKTLSKEDHQTILNELQKMGIAKREDEGLEGTFLQNMFEVDAEVDRINIKDWVTVPPSTLPNQSYHKTKVRQTVHRLKKKHKHHRKQFAKSISMTENRSSLRMFVFEKPL